MFTSPCPNSCLNQSSYQSLSYSSDIPNEPHKALVSPISDFVSEEDEQRTVQRQRMQIRLKEVFSSPIAKKMMGIQKQMREENGHPNKMEVAQSSDSQHSTVYVTPRSFRVQESLLGQGAQGKVYAVKRLFNDGQPDRREALKFSHKLPSGSSLLNELRSEELSNLNFSTQSYTLPSESFKYCDVLPLADSDFQKFDFSKVEKPIQCMLNLMKDVAQGADVLHQKGFIHRDIKSDNILVLEGGRTGQLGDLDHAVVMLEEEHYTTCTPIYASPSIWGNDLMRQARRCGYQTKKDDAFSLGRTIQYGLISKIFRQHSECSELSVVMKPRRLKVLNNTAEVEQLVKDYDNSKKVLIVLESQEIEEIPGEFKIIPKHVVELPSKNELTANNLKGLEILKSKLDTNESQALECAIIIANCLQRDNPFRRPSMKQIVDFIKEFQDKLKTQVFVEPVCVPLQTKESQRDVDTDESSQSTKRMKTDHGQ